jgi:hypothetical protein
MESVQNYCRVAFSSGMVLAKIMFVMSFHDNISDDVVVQWAQICRWLFISCDEMKAIMIFIQSHA